MFVLFYFPEAKGRKEVKNMREKCVNRGVGGQTKNLVREKKNHNFFK